MRVRRFSGASATRTTSATSKNASARDSQVATSTLVSLLMSMPFGPPSCGLWRPRAKASAREHREQADRIAAAAPGGAVLAIDVDVARGGVGDEDELAVEREADAVRAQDVAQDAVGLGVRTEAATAVVEQHAVGVVIADRDPARIGAEADAVGNVEAASEQGLVGRRGEVAARIEDVTRHRMDVVVADEQLDRAVGDGAGGDRPGGDDGTRRSAADRSSRRCPGGGRGAGGGHVEHLDRSLAIGDDQRVLVEKAEAVRPVERRRLDLDGAVERHPRPVRITRDGDVEDGDPVGVEGGDGEAAIARRELHVLGPAETAMTLRAAVLAL